MNDGWVPCRDHALIVRLHAERNPGLYELLDQYSHLRPADFHRRSIRTWVHRSCRCLDGYAVSWTTPRELCLLALWGRCTGLADRTVLSWTPSDEQLLVETLAWIHGLNSAPARPIVVRIESDNSFGTLLARRFGWPLDTVLLLATRPTTNYPRIQPPAGYRIRHFEPGDERAFPRIHRDAFHRAVSPESYRRWAEKQSCETFSATWGGEVVGLMISELRRGGRLGDFNLAVATGHRGRGVGPALLSAGLRSLHRRGASRAVADHWATNGPAVSLYRRFGFHVERAYAYFRVR